MDILIFKSILVNSIKKLASDEVTPVKAKQELSGYSFSSEELQQFWSKFKQIILNFNGNAEKFFSNFFQFTLPSPNSLPVFPRLTRRVSNLLCNELAIQCLENLTKLCVVGSSVPTFKWTDKAKEVVEYLAGYCFRELYSRLHRKKKSAEIKALMAILLSAKIDPESYFGQKQRLIKIHDRGGLWMVNNKAYRIFELCEEHFHYETYGFKRFINANEMTEKMMKNAGVNSNFKNLCIQANVFADKEYSKNLLEKVMQLYFRVRSHSKARQRKETAKIEAKTAKKKSIRTEMKRAEEDSK
eukprot:TCONS_00032368-protein